MLDMEMFISTPIVETSKTDQLIIRKCNEVVTTEGFLSSYNFEALYFGGWTFSC